MVLISKSPRNTFVIEEPGKVIAMVMKAFDTTIAISIDLISNGLWSIKLMIAACFPSQPLIDLSHLNSSFFLMRGGAFDNWHAPGIACSGMTPTVLVPTMSNCEIGPFISVVPERNVWRSIISGTSKVTSIDIVFSHVGKETTWKHHFFVWLISSR